MENIELINRLATDLAKYEFMELNSLLKNLSFIDAFNKLKGFNLEMHSVKSNDTLIGFDTHFDYNYKHINGTIFQTDGNRCELNGTIAVWDDNFSSPIIEQLEIDVLSL